MKINSTFHVFVFLVAALMFSTPIVTLAQQNSVRVEAEAAAERDAEARTNKPLMCLLGCVGGILTVGFVYLTEPSIPTGALLGKSPEYVAFYTDAYISKTKDTRIQMAMVGCVAGNLLTAGLWVAVVVASAEASTR